MIGYAHTDIRVELLKQRYRGKTYYRGIREQEYHGISW